MDADDDDVLSEVRAFPSAVSKGFSLNFILEILVHGIIFRGAAVEYGEQGTHEKRSEKTTQHVVKVGRNRFGGKVLRRRLPTLSGQVKDRPTFFLSI